MIEEGLEDEGIYHAKALIQNEWFKKLQEQRALICRHELIVYVTKKQICTADGDAVHVQIVTKTHCGRREDVLKTHARKLFEVNRIGHRRL
jgi:hypothetical protein